MNICPNCFAKLDLGKENNYCSKCGINLNRVIKDDNLIFNAAQKCKDKGDYYNAVELFTMSAKNGNGNSMYELGLLYTNSNLEENKKNRYVMHCMERSALIGNQNAKLFLVDVYVNGKYGAEKDIDKAIKYWDDLEKYLKSDNKKFAFLDEEKRTNSDVSLDVSINKEITETDDSTTPIGVIKSNKGFLEEIGFDYSIDEKEADILTEEKNNLKECYRKMDETVDYYKSKIEPEELVPSSDRDAYYDEMAKRNSNKLYHERINEIVNQYENPYVMRANLDYLAKDEKYDIYVGKESICDKDNKTLVFSWTSPIGTWLYQEDTVSYNHKGEKVKLLLKRNVIIDNKDVKEVYELYNVNNDNSNNEIIADKYLLALLKKRREAGEVSDIVASIQKNQMKIISSSIYNNLIMQGCAGSGKTMVLFHRLKYIISNDLDNKSNIVIITPNEKFNSYIKPLINDLNLVNINAYSITDFYLRVLNGFIGGKAKYKWIDLLREKNEFGFKLEIKDDYDLPRKIVEYYYSNDFLDKVNGLDKISIHPLASLKPSESDIFKPLLGAKLSLELIPQYKRSINVLHKCELYALCLIYFRRCRNYKYKDDKPGFSTEYYDFDHTIHMIDEAQELSANEYLLINSLGNKKHVFNLFGDVEQSINSYNIKDWDDISSRIGNVSMYQINKNYRNSKEIIDFVNKKLGKTMKNVGYESYKILNINMENLESAFIIDSMSQKAIICTLKNLEETKKRLDSIKNNIFAVHEVKGMEFDSVYVIDDGMTDAEKYISYTRSLDKLTLVK